MADGRTLDSAAGATPGEPRARALVAIGALSAGVLLFELDLIRVFSFTIWHHFTFMVVSVALLGFAVSGVLLHVRPAVGDPPLARAGWFALGFAVSSVAAVATVARIPLDLRRIAAEPAQIGGLLVYYAVLVVPFGFAGVSIAALLAGFARSARRLYGADLAGAGLGAALSAAAIAAFGGDGVIFFAAALAALAAALLFSQARSEAASGRALSGPRTGWRPRPALAAATAIGALALVPWADPVLPIRAGPGKGLASWQKKHAGARAIFTRWSALGRVDVIEDAPAVSWTLNPRSPFPETSQTNIVIDGDAATPMLPWRGDISSLEFLDWTLPGAPLQAFHPERVLVIGAGGGADVLAALRHGAKKIDAVEIHPVIAGLVRGPFAERTGRVFDRPEVRLHVDDGRAFLRSTEERYGAIVLTLIDTWAASAAGAYSLAEGYLYTVEAFEDYLDRLDDDGVLVITRWDWRPPRESLRLCAVADSALRRAGGKDPSAHVVVLALQSMGAVVVKRTPFTSAELRALAQVAASRGIAFVYAPGMPGESPFSGYLTAVDKAAFADAYPLEISPVTDDAPFFFQFGRWRDANPLGKGWRDSPLVLSGRLVLVAILLQAALLSVVLLAAPLLWERARRGDRTAERAPLAGGRTRVLGYFFLVGLGFMLLEIVLLQRFTLLLASPVRAATVALAVLLLSAGAGSAFAARLAPDGRRPEFTFSAIGALGVAYAALLPVLFRSFLGAPLSLRTLLSVVILAPLGFLLGVPFPAGIVRLERAGARELVGWAWAANGCASVIGPIVAVLLAIDVGFTVVMAIGAATYGGAFVAFGPWWTAGDRTGKPAGGDGR